MQELYKKFKYPKHYSDYWLVCFLVQFLLIAGLTLAFSRFVDAVADFPPLMTKSTTLASVIDAIRNPQGDPKTLQSFSPFIAKMPAEYTDRVIDLKHYGLWLTDRQSIVCMGLYIAAYVSCVLFSILGIGLVFSGMRRFAKNFTLNMLPFFVLLIPIAIWFMVLYVFFFFTAFFTVLLMPVFLPANLIIGIVQLVNRSKNKNRQYSEPNVPRL